MRRSEFAVGFALTQTSPGGEAWGHGSGENGGMGAFEESLSSFSKVSIRRALEVRGGRFAGKDSKKRNPGSGGRRELFRGWPEE
jgi:hypothetical protein